MQKLLVTNAGGVTKSLYDQGTLLLSDFSKIPANTAGGALAAYTYTNFNGTAATISSTLPT